MKLKKTGLVVLAGLLVLGIVCGAGAASVVVEQENLLDASAAGVNAITELDAGSNALMPGAELMAAQVEEPVDNGLLIGENEADTDAAMKKKTLVTVVSDAMKKKDALVAAVADAVTNDPVLSSIVTEEKTTKFRELVEGALESDSDSLNARIVKGVAAQVEAHSAKKIDL